MKLGEALRLRSDNYKKIEELRARATAGAQIQDGQDVPEDPASVLAEIERLSNETLSLVQRINRTNVFARLASGQPVVDSLAERDYYLHLRTAYQTVAQAASGLQQRYLKSEIKIVRTIDPMALRKKADDLARRHRVLDVAIQEVNWTTELVD